MRRTGKRWLWAGAAGAMALPALAQLLSREMNWAPGDFLAWALMILVACGAMLLAARLLPGRRPRLLAGAAIVALFLALWVELAVGIVGPG